MKKILAAVILTALTFGMTATVISAKKSDEGSRIAALMQKYGKEEGVETININGFLLGIAKAAAKNEEGGEWLRYLDRMSIFSAEEAGAPVKERFLGELGPILTGYEQAMEMKDGDEDMSVWIKMKDGETISELVMVSESEAAVIFMCGKIPVSEIGKIIEDQQ